MKLSSNAEILEIKEIAMFFICSFFSINIIDKKNNPPYIKNNTRESELPLSPKKLFKGLKDKNAVEIIVNKRNNVIPKETNLLLNLNLPSFIIPIIAKRAIILKKGNKNTVLFNSIETAEFEI
jgi:hypothetical protein